MSDRMPPGTSAGSEAELPRRQPGAFQGAHDAPDGGFDAFAASDDATQIMQPLARRALDAAQGPIPHQAQPAEAAPNTQNAQNTVIAPGPQPPANGQTAASAQPGAAGQAGQAGQNAMQPAPNGAQGPTPVTGRARGENGEPLPEEFDHLFRGSAAGQSTTVLPAVNQPPAPAGGPQPGFPQQPGFSQQPGFPQQQPPGYPPQHQPNQQPGYPQQPPQYGGQPGWNRQQGGHQQPQDSVVPGFGPGPQQAGYPPQGGYQRSDMGSGWQDGGYQQDWQQREGSRRRVGVIAVACVAVLAIAGLAFALTSGGGKPSKPTAKQSPGTQTGAGEATAKQQLDAVYQLIQQSEPMRSVVNRAVGSIEQCKNQAQGADMLRSSAAKRRALAAQVAKLPVGKVSLGARLISLLQQSWSDSADSDTAFAAWGDGLSGPSCKVGKLPHDADYQQGVHASGVASNAKRLAAVLWSQVAVPAGEPQISATQF